MAKRTFLAGATSQTIDIFIQDSSSTIGAGLAALVFNSSGLKAYYRKGATGSATAVTLATQTVGGAWSSGGFVEIDATNMKGVYRFDIPDTVLASTPWATLYFYGATNMAPVVAELEIVSFNPFDGTRLGLTALPNAAAEAAGGLYTRGTGAGQIKQTNNGEIDANATHWNNLATVALPLIPTTAGRTLDVSAGGEAGVDWANVGSPTTAVGLTGTTIATSQIVASVTDKTGYALTAAYDLAKTASQAGDAMTLTASYDFAKGTAAMTESYAANGVAPTPVQAFYAIHQMLMDFSISGTTITVKKLDNTATAYAVTINSATTPTAAART